LTARICHEIWATVTTILITLSVRCSIERHQSVPDARAVRRRGKAPNSADARGSLKHVRRVVKIAKRLLRHLFVSLVAPEVWVARPSVCAAIYWVQVRGIRQQFNNYI